MCVYKRGRKGGRKCVYVLWCVCVRVCAVASMDSGSLYARRTLLVDTCTSSGRMLVETGKSSGRMLCTLCVLLCFI